MKVKVLPYLLFFVISLAFAYYASDSTEEKKRPSEEWLALPQDKIHSIHYEFEATIADVVRKENSQDYWVDFTATRSTQGGIKEEEGHFLAGDRMKEVLTSLQSFQVEKVIGAAKDIKLADFGLEKPSGRFEVKYGADKVFKLDIGKPSYQSQGIFVLDQDKQMVLMVNRKLFAPFERPKSRLALKNPYRFDPEDINAATLNAEEKHMEFVRHSKAGAKAWFTREKLDAPNEAFRNWLEKLLKLKVETYPDESQIATIEQLPRKFSLQLNGNKGELDLFNLYEDQSVQPPRYWLKSKSLPVPVGVDAGIVKVLIGDLAGILR